MSFRSTRVTLMAAGVAVLASACGGPPARQVAQVGSTTTRSISSPDSPVASPQQNGAVAYAGCMRSNGVRNWPDPNSSGVFDKSKLTPQQLAVSSSELRAAQGACVHLLPNGGSGPSPARLQQMKALGLRFAACVRSHGVSNFPDPGSDGRIPDPATVGINQGSPRFRAANQACRKDRPPYIPSNAAYDAYLRTHG